MTPPRRSEPPATVTYEDDRGVWTPSLLHDLESLVTHHLFVLSPNNSGSTYLKNVMRSSRHTWNLAREGQRTHGFVGPRGRDTGRQLIWAGRPDWIEEYRWPEHFDWEVTRRAWYAQAFASDPSASVFVEKSPPFLLITDRLVESFRGVRFVAMVRHPLAAYEGIIRRRVRRPPDDPTDPRILAADHLMACFEEQRRNIEVHGDRLVWFTYERLCADPDGCAADIAGLVPQLADLDLAIAVEVKGMYDEPLRDMNEQQLAALAGDDREVALRRFAPHAATLRWFGYVDLADECEAVDG